MALLLYVAIVWTGLSVVRPSRLPPAARPALRGLAVVCVIMLGADDPGWRIRRGPARRSRATTTFPLMDGHLVPADYAVLQPFLRNLTENIAAVQFDHRVLATLTLSVVLVMAAVGTMGRRLSACREIWQAGWWLLLPVSTASAWPPCCWWSR